MRLRYALLLVLAAGLNVGLARIAQAMGLPIYVDAVGTVFAAALGGAAWGAAAGLVGQLIESALLRNGAWLAFGAVHVLIALYVARAVRSGALRSLSRSVAAGAGLGMLAAGATVLVSLAAPGWVGAGGMVGRGGLVGDGMRWWLVAFAAAPEVVDKTVILVLVGSVLRRYGPKLSPAFPKSARAWA